MRVKMTLQDSLYRILYLFRPFTVIGTCLLLMALADLAGILFLPLARTDMAHDVILALITGITASVVVAVIIEMANNYQRNNKRWLLLSRLFSMLTHYTSEMDICTGRFDSGKAHMDMMREIHRDRVARGEESEEDVKAAMETASAAFSDEDDGEDWAREHDRIRWVFSLLPGIIPQIDEAYHSYDNVFRRPELESMDTILRDYEQIRNLVRTELMCRSTLQYGLDPRDPGELVTWLPERVKRDLGSSVLLTLAQEERKTEQEKIAEAILGSGTTGLSALGIELREGFLSEEEDSTSAEMSEPFPGRIISIKVAEIDREVINLQKIIKSEPGFGSFYTFMEERNAKYLR